MLKEAWLSGSDDSMDKMRMTQVSLQTSNVSLFKTRQVVLQRPNQQKLETPRVSYDGLEDARRLIWLSQEKSPGQHG